MTKRFVIYFLSLLWIATSCERQIAYEGVVTPELLVLQSEVSAGDTIIKAYVSRSRFFLDDETYNVNRYLMSDADTRMQRNSGEWVSMTWLNYSKAFEVHLDTPLQQGDTIRLLASHPSYNPISAEQIVVPKPNYNIWFYNNTQKTLYQNAQSHYIELVLMLDKYLKTDSVMLGISVGCRYFLSYKSRNRTYKTYGTTTYFGSTDSLFASVPNNLTGDLGYSTRYELFCTPQSKDSVFVTLKIPYSYPNRDSIENAELRVEEMVVSVNAHSLDSYLFRRSMYLGRDYSRNGDFDLVAGLNDMIGSEEDVQVYSNIDGGYGIFAACSRNKRVLKNIKTVTK